MSERVFDLDVKADPQEHFVLRDSEHIYVAGSLDQFLAIKNTGMKSYRMEQADIVIRRSDNAVLKIRY